MIDPVADFFAYKDKLARKVQVKGHMRALDGGEQTYVDPYVREEDEAPAPVPDTAPEAVPAVSLDGAVAEDDVTETSEVFDLDDSKPAEGPRFVMGKVVRAPVVVPSVAVDERRARDLELWRTWKDGGKRPEDLSPLLKAFRPVIGHHTSKFKGRVKLIPDSAIEAEFQLRFVDALDTYDPDKGAIGTYVWRYLLKGNRFVTDNQNIGRIPESRIYKIREFNKAREELAEEHGRPATAAELAAKLKWAKAEVLRMESEQRRDLLTQGFEEDPYSWVPSKSEEVLRLFKYELAGTERAVFEYLTGYGRPRLSSTGDIAGALHLQDYQVSRYKDSIKRKLDRYVRE